MASERPPTVSRGRRALGTAAQVAGVIGVILCLVAAIGVVLGRGWAVNTVDQLATGIDSQVARAEPLLDAAEARVAQVSDIVDQIVATSAVIAADPSPGPALADDLRARVAGLGERYLELRALYAQMREQIVSAADVLERLDRLVPGISLPQGPREGLQDLDARMQEIDARMTEVLNFLATNPVTSAVSGWAASISERVTGIAERIDRVETSIQQLQVRLTALRADLSAKADTAQSLITVGALGSVLVLLYLALVHVVLFVHGGEIRRGTGRTEPAPVAPAPAAPSPPPA